MKDTETPHITLHPLAERVQVRLGEALLADSTRAIELRERGYPPRRYLPREDVRMDLLTPSQKVTHCPFKGEAHYYGYGDRPDLAWSYEQPPDELRDIAGRLAFYS